MGRRVPLPLAQQALEDDALVLRDLLAHAELREEDQVLQVALWRGREVEVSQMRARGG